MLANGIWFYLQHKKSGDVEIINSAACCSHECVHPPPGSVCQRYALPLDEAFGEFCTIYMHICKYFNRGIKENKLMIITIVIKHQKHFVENAKTQFTSIEKYTKRQNKHIEQPSRVAATMWDI